LKKDFTAIRAAAHEGLTSVIGLEDVTLRDGLQNETRRFSVGEKLAVIRDLIEAGVKRIQAGAFVHPREVPQMADTGELFKNLPRVPGVVYSALVLNREGLERAAAAGARAVYTAISASEAHSLRNAHCGVLQAGERVGYLIEQAKANGVRVRAGVMMAFGGDDEGRIPPDKVLDLVRTYREAGVDEIDLADTSGIANPMQVFTLVKEAKRVTGEIPLSLHLHDALGMGLANMFAGILAGATLFDTCLGGLGGCPFVSHAPGNIATEDAAFMLSEMAVETGIEIRKICAAVRRLGSLLEKRLPGRLSRLPVPGAGKEL